MGLVTGKSDHHRTDHRGRRASDCRAPAAAQSFRKVARLDLIGEIQAGDSGAPRFQRGVTEYPNIGDGALLLSERELRLVYGSGRCRPRPYRQPAAESEHRRPHRHRPSGEPAFRHSRRHRRRQVERRRHHPAEDSRDAAEPAHLPGRSAQRIWPLLRRQGAGAQRRAICGCRSGCSISRRPSTPSSADGPASTRKSRFSRKSFRWRRRPICNIAAGTDRTAGQEARSAQRRLHRRHAGALPHRGPDQPARRAHGQAGKPLVAHGLSQADRPHSDLPQSSALRLHVRERQYRRRHHGGNPRHAVPAAAGRQADDHHAARRLPGRGGGLGGVGALPHGVRLRPVERRRRAAAVRLRGGAPLRARRQARSASARPAARSRASPRKAANTACSSAW